MEAIWWPRIFPSSSIFQIRLRYRRETRQPLQTSAFLNIPERLLEDNDENLALNVARRSQRLIDIATEVWPILQNGELSSSEKFEQISSRSAFIHRPENSKLETEKDDLERCQCQISCGFESRKRTMTFAWNIHHVFLGVFPKHGWVISICKDSRRIVFCFFCAGENLSFAPPQKVIQFYQARNMHACCCCCCCCCCQGTIQTGHRFGETWAKMLMVSMDIAYPEDKSGLKMGC